MDTIMETLTSRSQGLEREVPGTSLLNQQYQLHFGDKYAEVVSQTTRVCKTVINKPWWGSNRNVMLNNEGGMIGMRQSALSYIVEKGEITAGLKAYCSYLVAEYHPRNTLTSVDDIEVRSTIESQTSESLSGLPTGSHDATDSSVSLQSQCGLLYVSLNLSDTERDFWQTYSSVKDVREASALCSITIDEGYRIWTRVHNRAARKIQP